jgi:hypothetical protein
MTDENTLKAYADLQVQAILFSMDVDIETWSLVPTNNFEHPVWIKQWKDKQDGADFDTYIDIDQK